MMYKKYLQWLLLFTVLGCAVVMVFNYTADPFRYYTSKPVSLEDHLYRRYKMPGVVRNIEFDGVIIGSSYSQWIDPNVTARNLGGTWVNLSLQGSTLYEQYLILHKALRTGKVRKIFWEMRLDAFLSAREQTAIPAQTFPYYFYESTILTPFEYLLSIDVLKRSAKKVLNFSEAKTLYEPDKYNAGRVREDYCRQVNEGPADIEYSYETLVQNYFFNIQSLVSRYPDTEFILYFPPHSNLYFEFYQQYLPTKFKASLDLRRLLYSKVLDYDNVALHDFQAIENMAEDLNNFRDLSHYNKPTIERILLHTAFEGFRVTFESKDILQTRFENLIYKMVTIPACEN